MTDTLDKIANNSARISNAITIEIVGRRNRTAITRLKAEADDDSKEVQVTRVTYDSNGLVESILLDIET